MLEGLRYYIPLMLASLGTFLIGGVFVTIVWLLIASRLLRGERQIGLRGPLLLTAGVLLPLAVLLVPTIVGLIVAPPEVENSIISLSWWLLLLGSFALLMLGRRSLRTCTGIVADVVSAGISILIYVQGLGVCLQIFFLFGR